MKKNTDWRNAHQQQQVLYDTHMFHATQIHKTLGRLREQSVTESKKLYICVTIGDVAETEKLRWGGLTSL